MSDLTEQINEFALAMNALAVQVPLEVHADISRLAGPTVKAARRWAEVEAIEPIWWCERHRTNAYTQRSCRFEEPHDIIQVRLVPVSDVERLER